jgi:hypothetical protein
MPTGFVTDKLDGKRLVYDITVTKGPQLQRIIVEATEWDHATHERIAQYKHELGFVIKMRGSRGEPWTLCAVKTAERLPDGSIVFKTVHPRVDGFKTRRAAIEHRLYQMGIWSHDD